MIANKTILAIIPARGGSKGLPGKNIIELCGKPLIVWSIEAGLGSKYVDEVMVTTDSVEIAEVAKRYGASVPFMRPAELATDTATTFDAIQHAIESYKERFQKTFDYVVLLEPTSPLRDSDDIDIALNKLDSNRKKADSIVGVSRVESAHPVFDVKINNDGLIEPYIGKTFNVLRRQDIEDLYFFEGSVYISDVEVLMKKGSFYHERTIPYIVPRWKSLEIDEMVDLITAEAIMNNLSILDKGGAHE